LIINTFLSKKTIKKDYQKRLSKKTIKKDYQKRLSTSDYQKMVIKY